VSERDASPELKAALARLADQINELTVELAMLRESIVTAAEWDNQARQARQKTLDMTLASIRTWQRVLVSVNILLIGALIWFLMRLA
jgi:hypothetical protein